MNYFVIADDGQKYGPADIPTLNQWAQDRRVLPTSMLEDAATGARVLASQVPGINFPPPASGQPQGFQQYPRANFVTDNGAEEIKKAWIFGAIGLLCCPIVFSVLGIVNAVNAQKKGHPQATTALIFCICSLVIGIGANAYFRFSNIFPRN